MYKLKASDGTNNVCGKQVRRIRESLGLSQRKFAQMFQIHGFDLDHHFVRRLECGSRFVTDIELKMLAQVLNVSYDELLKDSE